VALLCALHWVVPSEGVAVLWVELMGLQNFLILTVQI